MYGVGSGPEQRCLAIVAKGHDTDCNRLKVPPGRRFAFFVGEVQVTRGHRPIRFCVAYWLRSG